MKKHGQNGVNFLKNTFVIIKGKQNSTWDVGTLILTSSNDFGLFTTHLNTSVSIKVTDNIGTAEKHTFMKDINGLRTKLIPLNHHSSGTMNSHSTRYQ